MILINKKWNLLQVFSVFKYIYSKKNQSKENAVQDDLYLNE
jgi:hypothetical protein